jgi:hypothetical protein
MSALGITYGCLFLALAVFPSIAAFASISSPDDLEVIMYLHPFYAISQVNQEYYDYSSFATMTPPETHFRSFVSFGLPHVIIYFAVALAFLGFATHSLNSAGWEDPMLTRKK